MNKFNPEKLIEEAIATTSLTDFGDGPFEHDFNLFINSVNQADMLLEGRYERAKGYIVNLLVNRLLMVQDFKTNPEILETELLPPVAILSLPRTGTTKLQRLLGNTGNFQNLLYWHTHMFARLPEYPDGGISERISATQEFENWAVETVPRYYLGHPMHALEPEEDVQLVNSTFRSMFLTCMFVAPEYSSYLGTADFSPTFDYMFSVLKYLQWQFYADNPKGWFLKSPGHYGMEHQYQRIFPQGIKFICPQRDPKESIPSMALAGEVFMETFSKPMDRKLYGQPILQQCLHQTNMHMSWRDSNPDASVLYLSYKEIRDDSVATAEKVYKFLEMDLDDCVRSEIAKWDEKHPLNKHGKNTHSLEEWGLTESMIEEAFSGYYERFSHLL